VGKGGKNAGQSGLPLKGRRDELGRFQNNQVSEQDHGKNLQSSVHVCNRRLRHIREHPKRPLGNREIRI
jgi:hypothetical protein